MAALTKNAIVSATVESMVLKRIARRIGSLILLQLAALHQRRMQIQVVRHHRRADDPDRHVNHSVCRKPGVISARPISQKAGLRLRQHENLDEVADRDRHDQHQHDRLDRPHSEALQGQQQQHVQAGNDDGPEQRNVEQQIERDRAAEHFRQVAGADRQFAQQPVRPARPLRVPIAAALGQIFARSPRPAARK